MSIGLESPLSDDERSETLASEKIARLEREIQRLEAQNKALISSMKDIRDNGHDANEARVIAEYAIKKCKEIGNE